MILSDVELRKFLELFREKSEGKISGFAVEKMIDAARKTSSRSDKDIVYNMVVVAKKLGQDKENVTTVLAETISKRQKALESEKREVGKVIEMRIPQVLYGPPKREEAIIEMTREPQMLYGPPKIQKPGKKR